MLPTYVQIDSSRPKARIRPVKALRHMSKLLSDKEDTRQVFHIIEALNGNALRRNFACLLETEKGQARLAERRNLAAIMDNHKVFSELAPDSVGRKYIEFMHSEGLTAAGLVKESQTRSRDQKQFNDDLTWFSNRLRDTHDLLHVLTGYGRDGLGEAALLMFSNGQNPARGAAFISHIAFRQMGKTLSRRIDFQAVKEEAIVNGKAAANIVEQDILALMREPISDVRARLKIAKPAAYETAVAVYMGAPVQRRGTLEA